jgi:glucose-6-phosphate isomerase
MPFAWSIEHARAERIGAEGVAAADLAAAIGRTGQVLDWLRARHADGSLPLLRLPAERSDLAAITMIHR